MRDGVERKVGRNVYSKRDKENLQSIQQPIELIFVKWFEVDLIGAKFGKLLANDWGLVKAHARNCFISTQPMMIDWR